MLKKLFIFSLLVILTSLDARTNDFIKNQMDQDLQYNETIRSFMKDNKRISKLVYKAYASVVFPSITKGAAVFGYASGDGRAYFRGGVWTGNVQMSQYSVGVQVGASNYSEIIFFRTREAFERFKLGEYEDSNQVSLVPFYSGLSADKNFDEGVEVYTSSSGGLMLEASTGTQVFSYLPKKQTF